MGSHPGGGGVGGTNNKCNSPLANDKALTSKTVP